MNFWSEGNVYWSWYWLNKNLNPSRARFYIAVGICFPHEGAFGYQDPVGVPKHEPFFFVWIADDWETNKATALIRETPEGWTLTSDDYVMIAARAVSQFDADPDSRVQSLIAWAQELVGRAVTCIPNFEAAPVENIAEEGES